MKIKALVGALALLSAGFALAEPKSTVLEHQDGSKTKVSTEGGHTRTTGWYGGEGGLTTDKGHKEAVKEATQAAQDKGNPVVKTGKDK